VLCHFDPDLARQARLLVHDRLKALEQRCTSARYCGQIDTNAYEAASLVLDFFCKVDRLA